MPPNYFKVRCATEENFRFIVDSVKAMQYYRHPPHKIYLKPFMTKGLVHQSEFDLPSIRSNHNRRLATCAAIHSFFESPPTREPLASVKKGAKMEQGGKEYDASSILEVLLS